MTGKVIDIWVMRNGKLTAIKRVVRMDRKRYKRNSHLIDKGSMAGRLWLKKSIIRKEMMYMTYWGDIMAQADTIKRAGEEGCPSNDND